MFTPSERDSLWSDYAPLIAKLIRRWEGMGDREDLRGDLFVRFSSLLDAYDSSRGVPLVAYLARMLDAFCFTRWRAGTRISRREIRLVPAHGEMVGEDPTPGWDARLERDRILLLLGPAVAELSSGRRQAVTLRYLEELEYSEVAARMGVTEGTARSQVRFGVNALRRALL